MWDWGCEQQAASEKAKILVKQVIVLGISQAGLPFKLDVSVTLEYMGWALTEIREGERTPRILVSVLEEGKNLSTPIEQRLLSV